MTTEPEDMQPVIDLESIRSHLKPIDMKGFYDGFNSFAQYGPTYQRIISWSRGYDSMGREEILVQLRGAGSDLP